MNSESTFKRHGIHLLRAKTLAPSSNSQQFVIDRPVIGRFVDDFADAICEQHSHIVCNAANTNKQDGKNRLPNSTPARAIKVRNSERRGNMPRNLFAVKSYDRRIAERRQS